MEWDRRFSNDLATEVPVSKLMFKLFTSHLSTHLKLTVTFLMSSFAQRDLH